MYLIPMSKVNEDENNEQYVECKVRENQHMCIIDAVEEGYRTKFFIKDYFDWLIYRGYVKVVD